MTEEEVLTKYYQKKGFNELLIDFLQQNETIKTLETAIEERDEIIEKLSK